MSYVVYIIYSKKLNRYYVGNTELDIADRLKQHNESYNKGSYTSKGIPWELFLTIECITRLQARSIELHIKKMKNRTYIENLKQYTELRSKLKNKFI